MAQTFKDTRYRTVTDGAGAVNASFISLHG